MKALGKLTKPSIEDLVICINSYTKNASLKFGVAFFESIKGLNHGYSDLIIVCIGTDRAIGDSLGPIIGYKLEDVIHKYNNIHLYGTLEKPVHATNLDTVIDIIYNRYSSPLVIAIDACLGDMSHVGYLTITRGSVMPGSGVGKRLTKIGDIAITGIVNYSGSMELIILQNTRLNIIMKMADVISDGIFYGLTLLDSAIAQ